MRNVFFFCIVIAVLSSATYYLGSRILPRLAWAQKHRRIFWSCCTGFVLIQILSPLFYRLYPDTFAVPSSYYWVVNTLLGIYAVLFFYLVFNDILTSLWRYSRRPKNTISFERRSFLTVGAVTLSSAIAGGAQAATGPNVYEVDVPLHDLPEDFEGFKIVQLTDLHVGPTIGRSYTERVVEAVNLLAPDLVALTGDFVDGSVSTLRNAVEPLSRLRSQHGTYFVTGNHEYYSGVESWIEEFQRLGAKVLHNQHVLIKQGQSELVLAGIPDAQGGRFLASHVPDVKQALKGAPAGLTKILLAHQPNSYKQSSAEGVHLQLSGHTHAGQFFPWSLMVALAHRYYRGLNRHENMWVYVSRGTGYWGPPTRFAIPSEISLIRLKRGRLPGLGSVTIDSGKRRT